jgi:hypothetical protein
LHGKENKTVQHQCILIDNIVYYISSPDNEATLRLYSTNLRTFWLKIEQYWPFEEISIFSNSGSFSVKFFFQPIYTDYAN